MRDLQTATPMLMVLVFVAVYVVSFPMTLLALENMPSMSTIEAVIGSSLQASILISFLVGSCVSLLVHGLISKHYEG
mgnify:CR=1 FL=1